MLDQVDIPFLEELTAAWTEMPPARAFLAAQVGYKPKPRPSRDYAQLFHAYGGKLK